LNQNRPQYVINVTEVKFRWQLGLLIGEGQYGKVYSCVNLDTGEPMAMKEIPFKSNDIETIKGIADEIINVQDLNHENLVKFYGAELHRKEILIFMEFCGDQSTLDRLSRDASGLPENIVRVYTKSLLRAVYTLHENKIMHRDIKGANIFLKAIDPKHPERIVLKLGDFGCSIKFKEQIGAINNNKYAKATGFMGTFRKIFLILSFNYYKNSEKYLN
jgi:mitogen-activated protein kinase kinase kinase 4